MGCVAMSCFASAGPSDTLYITANDGANLVTVSGTTVNTYFTAFGDEGPIVVTGLIKTTGIQPGGLGGSYKLNGSFSGNIYQNELVGNAEDATTDGLNNFVIDDQGNVYETNAEFELPTLIISAGSNATGLSYEPLNHSLWVDSKLIIFTVVSVLDSSSNVSRLFKGLPERSSALISFMEQSSLGRRDE